MATLTIKQEDFAQDVANGKHEFFWESYTAHYDASKMSKNAISVEACRLLANPKVALRIKEIRDENAKSLRVELKEVLEHMAMWLRGDPINIYDDDGNILPLSKMSKATRACIADIETKETFEAGTFTGRIRKVKLRDPIKVAEMQLKVFGAFAKDNLREGDESHPELLQMLRDNGLLDDKK